MDKEGEFKEIAPKDCRPEVVGNMFLALLLLDAAWILFGSLIFRLTDVYVRKRGSLEEY
jgi:hypothetical protein